MKRSHEIFSRSRVDSGFSTNRCIDHREQRSGHLDDWYTAHEGRRDETREITDHATANRNNRGVPTRTPVE